MASKFFFAAAVGMAFAAFAVPAQAAEREDMGSVAVSVRAVDQNDPMSIDRLHRDIVRAATRVCRMDYGRTIEAFRAVRECRANAVERAVADSNMPMLVALNEALPMRERYNAGRRAPNETVLTAMRNATPPIVTASIAQ